MQLKSRHWRIKYEGGRIEKVDGDGVIGLYPIFTHDDIDQPFEYNSNCYGLFISQPIEFSGYLNFVLGRIQFTTDQEVFPVHIPEMKFRKFKRMRL